MLRNVGDRDAAYKRLRRALREDNPAIKRRVDEALADAREMDLPRGGFLWHEDQFITRRDLERININKVVASNVAGVAHCSLGSFGRGFCRVRSCQLCTLDGALGSIASHQ